MRALSTASPRPRCSAARVPRRAQAGPCPGESWPGEPRQASPGPCLGLAARRAEKQALPPCSVPACRRDGLAGCAAGPGPLARCRPGCTEETKCDSSSSSRLGQGAPGPRPRPGRRIAGPRLVKRFAMIGAVHWWGWPAMAACVERCGECGRAPTTGESDADATAEQKH